MKALLLLALFALACLVYACPPGVPRVSCFRNPCDGARCRAYPMAYCTPNYCGGCGQDWTFNDLRVNCTGLAWPSPSNRPRPSPGRCPPNKPRVMCFRNPCDGARCPAYPMASCTANYCGGCFQDWTYNGRSVNCTGSGWPSPSNRPPSPSRTRCPPNKPPVMCFRDPCQGASCPMFPRATCVPNYCGGCRTRWFQRGMKVKCNATAE